MDEPKSEDIRKFIAERHEEDLAANKQTAREAMVALARWMESHCVEVNSDGHFVVFGWVIKASTKEGDHITEIRMTAEYDDAMALKDDEFGF
jgi:hypothetical protein